MVDNSSLKRRSQQSLVEQNTSCLGNSSVTRRTVHPNSAALCCSASSNSPTFPNVFKRPEIRFTKSLRFFLFQKLFTHLLIRSTLRVEERSGGLPANSAASNCSDFDSRFLAQRASTVEQRASLNNQTLDRLICEAIVRFVSNGV